MTIVTWDGRYLAADTLASVVEYKQKQKDDDVPVSICSDCGSTDISQSKMSQKIIVASDKAKLYGEKVLCMAKVGGLIFFENVAKYIDGGGDIVGFLAAAEMTGAVFRGSGALIVITEKSYYEIEARGFNPNSQGPTRGIVTIMRMQDRSAFAATGCGASQLEILSQTTNIDAIDGVVVAMRTQAARCGGYLQYIDTQAPQLEVCTLDVTDKIIRDRLNEITFDPENLISKPIRKPEDNPNYGVVVNQFTLGKDVKVPVLNVPFKR